jgi:hypothetical protein
MQEIVRKFAFIVDGEVAGVIGVPNTFSDHEKQWAVLSSEPIVIESTNNPDVDSGWTYDGQNFIAPENE